VGEGPLGPYVKAEENPILERFGEVTGTGHSCMFDGPEGLMICYHGRTEATGQDRVGFISPAVLENGKLPRELVRRIYELRTLRINGEYPNVFSCVGCGGKEHLHTYSPSHYGMVCDDCVEPGMSGVKISKDLLYVLQFILSVDMKKLYSFELSEELFSGLESFVKAYWHQNIDHTFKTERFL
jgi:hypothetical protein